MVFKNPAQKRACLYKWIDDVREGIEPPRWNCEEYAKIRYAGRLRKVHRGPRGGYYVMVKGKKRYLKLDYA